MSDDEFDSLPDPFEGIDWDKVSIPALSSSSQVPASTTDTLSAAFPDYPPNSPHSSDQYTFDDVDEAFLNEVSILEAQFFSKETGLQHFIFKKFSVTDVLARFYRYPLFLVGFQIRNTD